MKFGKRLTAEASRRWSSFYIDYKALKRALHKDVQAADPAGAAFYLVLRHELQKISAFYVEKEEELQAIMQGLQGKPSAQLAAFRAEVHDLKKYVVLNYIAVIKAIKKRNRHLQAVCGPQVPILRSVDVLAQQYFFTSPLLAGLATQAEVLQGQVAEAAQPASEVLQRYQCPICLGILRTPVVLTCDHRFCWGCIIAHCAAVAATTRGAPWSPPRSAQIWADAVEEQWDEGQDGRTDNVASSSLSSSFTAGKGATGWKETRGAVAPFVLVSDDESAPVATFDCPSCRRPHLMDVDKLQVDPHLSAYIEQLVRKEQQSQVNTQIQTNTPSHLVIRINAQEPVATEGKADSAAAHSTVSSAPIAIPGASRAPSAPVHTTDDDVCPSTAKAGGLADEEEAQQFSTASSTPSEGMVLADVEQATKAVEVVPAAAKPPLMVFPEAPSTAAVKIIPPQQSQPQLPKQRDGGRTAVLQSNDSAADHMEVADVAESTSGPPLLPPQAGQHAGKLTVVLDLDGTLVSSFTPRRAPVLPPGAVGYVVGKGGKLNPQGVFVVERPGLKEFFQRVCAISEVVLFTAGLEDYAKPIVDALEARYGRCFSSRLYRPATTSCEIYPCIKDLSRLGRDLTRTLLVDDTPLAFYKQPNNGIPVLAFKSDPDDRILLEAVAPMLESLAGVTDIRPVLYNKFNMPRWFMVQGLPVSEVDPSHPKVNAGPPHSMRLYRKAASDSNLVAQQAARQGPVTGPLRQGEVPARVLLVLDFDKTLTDCDAGEAVVGALAPELVPMLASLEMPANFVPMTNTVLAEMQRRGISRDKLLSTLRTMGTDIPSASVSMLRWAAARKVDVRILSDCNSVFISHMLAGARATPYVREVITNSASFERAPTCGDAVPTTHLQRDAEGAWAASMSPRAGACAHRLVVHPRHPYDVSSHGCPLCPENLCKGAELRQLREASTTPSTPRGYARIIYCGDGANDICPALQLGPQDVVLPRRGYSLDKLIQQRQAGQGPDSRQVVAKMAAWDTHAQLFSLVQQAVNAVPM